MKLVIQIPCLNEAKTLPLVLSSIPKKIHGIDEVIILIIDDGSTDETVQVAKDHGVKHFVRHRTNQGLARTFHDGVNAALELGADIVVNTDGDNQYPQEKIADLVQPILKQEADIVIADRQTHKIEHFSPIKKRLQRLGTSVVNKVAGTQIPDAVSGFRAYSRSSLMALNTITRFSYTTETIIQAGNKKLAITSVPIEVNPKLRESRLFKSNWEHISKTTISIIRAFVMYRPYVLFFNVGLLLTIGGLVPFGRYLYFTVQHEHGNHIQSLLVGVVLMSGAFLSFTLGIVADLIRINRILQEDSLEHLKHLRFDR